MKKNILGLDLGPNSIGWAVVQTEDKEADGLERAGNTLFSGGRILLAGSRIVPMSGDVLNNFQKGVSVSQTAERTRYRGVRRQYERFHLRRERLNRALSVLEYLPAHYAQHLDRYGNFSPEEEPRLAWRPTQDGKYEFVFRTAFLEMVDDFRQLNPDWKQIPYDWTIYYLRKKALSKRLTPEELAWVLHSFNQKRGFNAVRGEVDSETEQADKLQEYRKSRLVQIEDTGEKTRGNPVYRLTFEDETTFEIPLRRLEIEVGDEVEYIVTTKLDEEGQPKKKGDRLDISYKIPGAADAWTLIKLRAESTIDQSHSTVGEYIYNAILNNPQQKIRGELVRTVDRRFYRDELDRILSVQIPLHPAVQIRDKLEECLLALYPNNEAHRNAVRTRGFKALLMEDIILYQRPLKSKKYLIDTCKYESHSYINKEGKRAEAGVRCASRSHPLFQEFRLWQFLENLRILERKVFDGQRLRTDVDVTDRYLPDEEAVVQLFDWLQTRQEVSQSDLLKQLKLSSEDFRWNYVEDRKYPAAETRAEMLKRLKKAGAPSDFLTPLREMRLWEILYAVNTQDELRRALHTYARKNGLDEERFYQSFKNTKKYDADYCAYSVKALRRLLPLMRRGIYWSEEAIDPQTRERIQKLIDGEWDENLAEQVREKTIRLRKVDDFKGLPVWLASYVVYNRHSEASDIRKWKSCEDMDADIKKFRQHSLRNPIVEQVCLEALRTVRDIWQEVGQIDEIHVEMGREMRATAKERERRHLQQLDNEQKNLRIKALLQEFMNPEYHIENVRPYSPSQQELLHIYEETVLEQEAGQIEEPIREILRKFAQTDVSKRPSSSEVLRYKLWLEQKYRSPYTGEVIPLGKLFTAAYQIEHVIPQSVYYDNSYNNKVICEAEVNLLKGNQLGMAFILKHAGEKVQCSMGRAVQILTPEAYRQFVLDHYKGRKQQILLSEEIPTNFTARQMNDTRYISRFIIGELSKLVRQQNADGTLEQEATSKNVVVVNGAVTDKLKKDWGLMDVWNDIIAPRFKRLNRMEGSQRFGEEVCREGKRFFQIQVPLELQRGFQRKRIDHRHHAMDAIVIACATRGVVNYLNNLNAHEQEAREDLKRAVSHKQNGDWLIDKPWPTFTQEAREQLQQIVVSFKRNLRIINKTSNHYLRFDPQTGRKTRVPQVKGDNRAIRKPLHKESVFARVNLRTVKTTSLKNALQHPERIVDKLLKQQVLELKRLQTYDDKRIIKFFAQSPAWQSYDFGKVEVYTFSDDEPKTRMCAIRKRIDESFDAKKIGTITDTGIRQILLRHLEACGGNPKEAFSAQGIEQLNNDIVQLNNGKPHQPIYTVRISEPLGLKFAVGTTGKRSRKFVEAAKGTNLFFAVYDLGEGRRGYSTLPLNEVIERKKLKYPTAPEHDEEGNPLLFVLSPGDLVYLPTEEERLSPIDITRIDKTRIYKMVSSTGKQCYFLPVTTASPIVSGFEYEALNKMERSLTGEMIKESCVPIEVDRLGRYKLR